MSFVGKLKERTIHAREQLNKAIQTELDHLQVSEETTRQRLSICNSCDHLFKPTMQCKKCGCFLYFKTKLSVFSCPIKKW